MRLSNFRTSTVISTGLALLAGTTTAMVMFPASARLIEGTRNDKPAQSPAPRPSKRVAPPSAIYGAWTNTGPAYNHRESGWVPLGREVSDKYPYLQRFEVNPWQEKNSSHWQDQIHRDSQGQTRRRTVVVNTKCTRPKRKVIIRGIIGPNDRLNSGQCYTLTTLAPIRTPRGSTQVGSPGTQVGPPEMSTVTVAPGSTSRVDPSSDPPAELYLPSRPLKEGAVLPFVRSLLPNWNLNNQLSGRKNRNWDAAINIPNTLYPIIYNVGGGFIEGPDRQRYPIVVPGVFENGHWYTADHPYPRRQPITTLNGIDTGWTTVAYLEDTGILGSPISGWDRLTAFVVGTANKRIVVVPASMYKHLHISPTGSKPWLSNQPRVIEPEGPPESYSEESREVIVRRADGTLIKVDRSNPGSWPRDVRRSGLKAALPSTPSKVAAGVDLAVLVGEGLSNAVKVGETKRHRYSVSFEKNKDGRRRAIIRSYKLGLDPYRLIPSCWGADVVISPSHIYLDEKGQMQDEPIVYRQGVPTLSKPDPSYCVAQSQYSLDYLRNNPSSK